VGGELSCFDEGGDMASLGAGQFEVADAHGAVAAADEGEKIVVHEPIAAHREEDGNAPARALWTGGADPCLWSPARRANPGNEPRARGPATGDPRLRALPASRHRTRIGHRTRAQCPNLLQRRPRTPRTADITAESCGFISATRTPQRPLQQIWTTGDPLGHPQPGGPRPSTSPDPPDPEDRVLAASTQRARSGHRPDHGTGRVRRRTRGARRRPERRSQMSNMSPTAPESPVFSLGSSP